MADAWKVFRCPACSMCHGRKSSGHNCPHCGQRVNEKTPVVDHAANPAELRMKVLMANTPPELRESLVSRLDLSETLFDSSSNFSPSKGLSVLRKSLDEDGKFTIDAVKLSFKLQGFEEEVNNFLEMAEAQGTILRLAEGIWQFLE
ncbi:MAG: hypothetical protein ACPGIG_04930 [Candidatus Poseidoniaceae archaeon]